MPTPTRADTNERLFARLRAGDRYAEDDLCRVNLPLARSVAGKWSRLAKGRLEYDDLLSAALLGLLSAVRGYEPEHGCAFSTYAVTAMNRKCQRALIDSDPIRVPSHAQAAGVEAAKVLSLDHPIGEEQADTLGDMLPADDDTEGESLSHIWTEQALSRLPDRERLAVAGYVLKDRTLAELAVEFGMTREGSRRLVKRGLERLAAVA